MGEAMLPIYRKNTIRNSYYVQNYLNVKMKNKGLAELMLPLSFSHAMQ
jgi:hypothetical protein